VDTKKLFAFLIIVVLSIGSVSTLHSTLANTVLTGLGIPSQTIGSNGDFYVDKSTGQYYQKNTNNWIASSFMAAQTTMNSPYILQNANFQPIMSPQGVLLYSPNYSTQTNTGTNVYCSNGVLNSQGYCVDSQGGIVGSTNYYSPSNCNFGIDPQTNQCNKSLPALHSNAYSIAHCSTGLINSQGYCVDSQGGILYSPSPTLQSNSTQYNNFPNTNCSTRMMNAQGYCVDSQGGIVGSPTYAYGAYSNTNCPTGVVTSQGYCTYNPGNVFPNSSTNTYCSTGILNSQGYCVNSVLNSQSSCINGVLNAQGYCVDSQGGILNAPNLLQSSPNTSNCIPSALNPSGYACTQGGVVLSSPVQNPVCSTGIMNAQGYCVNAQGGILSPNYSTTLSNTIPNTNCSTGIMNAQGYCVTSQGVILGTPTSISTNSK